MNSLSKLALPAALALTLVACGDSAEKELISQLPVDSDWWQEAQTQLQSFKEEKARRGEAKNVILFVGDGMSIPTITAARIFDGQSRGEDGESNSLSFERFPYTALVKTYNTNQQVPDSAGTATAMHTGVKTKAGVINVHEDVARGDCAESLKAALPSIGEIAENKGLATGIVTTTRITHATPATVFAHAPERDWEADTYMPEAAREAGCKDIARQLIEFDAGNGIDIALGGGIGAFLTKDQGGARTEGNLVEQWQTQGGEFVATAEELAKLKVRSKRVLGLFSPSHMTYMADRSETSAEPTLTQMTTKAIELLQDRGDGYYLLVEGGRIDHGHHAGQAGKALMEAQEFAKAIQAAVDMVDLDETLIMVTADHSHTMTMSGYPTRNNGILDVVHNNDEHGAPKEKPVLLLDKKPYTTLTYANGPGYVKGERKTPGTGIRATQQALLPTYSGDPEGEHRLSETHGGDDVALFATGARADVVRGVVEQNMIFHIIANAYGWDFD